MADNEPQPTPQTLPQTAKDYGVAIFVAVVLALGIRFFLIEAYRIPSTSMRPVLEPGDIIFVAKWPFGLRWPGNTTPLTSPRLPHRGEVVIFSPLAAPNTDFIKRVVALPGEHASFKGGRLWIGGQIAAEAPRPDAPCATEKTADNQPYTVCYEPPLIEDVEIDVPRDSVLLAGDLRSSVKLPSGSDSLPKQHGQSTWMIAPMSSLKGKALCTWLSIGPTGVDAASSWFPEIRFKRMFRRIP